MDITTHNPLTNGWFPELQTGMQLFNGWFFPYSANIGKYGLYINENSLPSVSTEFPYTFFTPSSNEYSFSYSYNPNSLYYIAVTRFSACGPESDASYVVVWTDSAGNPYVICYAPTQVNVTSLSGGQISISWHYEREGNMGIIDPDSFTVRLEGFPEYNEYQYEQSVTYSSTQADYSVTVTLPSEAWESGRVTIYGVKSGHSGILSRYNIYRQDDSVTATINIETE